MTDFTPREIVSELERHIVGQDAAKRAVAIALRDRWRRRQLVGSIRSEVAPKNILMIGPTGCGKTEIARRLARLAKAPFIKVEATKFTEIGYVGRDVEQIIRDLTEIAATQVREKLEAEVQNEAKRAAEERILDALTGPGATNATRERFRQMLDGHELDDREIEVELSSNADSTVTEMPFGVIGAGFDPAQITDMMSRAMGGGDRTKKRRIKVGVARDEVLHDEAARMVDEDRVKRETIELVEESGIVFLDEIDKICRGSSETARGGEISREGVQRDLLPLLDGTTVATRRGTVSTNHILFIASGAFHMARPSELLPELQGRLPIRVELAPLSTEDFRRILIEPQNNLLAQYQAMLGVEGLSVSFDEDAIAEIAEIATQINSKVENIGARRLHTVLERLMEEISFQAPDLSDRTITITATLVRERLSSLIESADLSRFIL